MYVLLCSVPYFLVCSWEHICFIAYFRCHFVICMKEKEYALVQGCWRMMEILLNADRQWLSSFVLKMNLMKRKKEQVEIRIEKSKKSIRLEEFFYSHLPWIEMHEVTLRKICKIPVTWKKNGNERSSNICFFLNEPQLVYLHFAIFTLEHWRLFEDSKSSLTLCLGRYLVICN